jgi:micrococcal nuclease
LLRYVYVGDVMVNAELVRQGYARARAYPPDTKYQDQLAALQREAQEAGLGLWAAEPAAAPAATAAPTPGGDCDPAYPDVCIPPPPPDLDCDDIPHRNFKVLPPDPHRFDGQDSDGIGCEE